MSRNSALLSALILAGCASGPHPPAEVSGRDAPARVVAREADLRPDFEAEITSVIRADAQRSYGPECGRVTVPDRAFIPVELTGGGLPEYAVTFGRVHCEATGGAGPWTGTGGVMMQFWIGSGGPARLLLEHSMFGFTIEPERLVSLQHGAFCPGGAGPSMCLVSYAWNDKDRRLDVVARRFYEGDGNEPPRMARGYEELSR